MKSSETYTIMPGSAVMIDRRLEIRNSGEHPARLQILRHTRVDRIAVRPLRPAKEPDAAGDSGS